MTKQYSTNGFVIHKRVYLLFLSLWFLFAVVTLITRINEIWGNEKKLLSLLALVILFFITLYMVYMIKSSMITLTVRDDGVDYETAVRKGLFFYETSRFAPWDSIIAISIIDKKKGPLKISTKGGDIIYWNIVNLRENNDLYDSIDNRIKRS